MKNGTFQNSIYRNKFTQDTFLNSELTPNSILYKAIREAIQNSVKVPQKLKRRNPT